MMKDRCYDLVRQHTFKMECIEKADELKQLLESERLHKEEGRLRAIYDLKGDPRHDEEKILSRFANTVEYIWNLRMTPILLVIAAIFFGMLTLLVAVFEISLYLEWSAASSLYQTWIQYSDSNEKGSFFLANIICMLPLAYICAASFYGFFKIKVNSFYALHPKQGTDPSCLVYSGMLLMRLSISVAYNFLELSQVKECAFFEVMGPLVKIQFLGEGFNKWIFPSLLLITVFLTAFDCYGRLLNCVGLKQFAFDEHFAEEKVIEGQGAIERYHKRKALLDAAEKNTQINELTDPLCSVNRTDATPLL
uniref:Uncharacterized protein n=1 Tax=Favella ehrenbergii TaxID=182087 RepID=A0A7S3MI77_9SPIT|mmetsp:Transcript_10783/g.13513  ORF Transcript_10783/g.13513 Transcript_10783/m.13513 type:complete len:307 (+) Transcript_10783:885-1805(+)